MIKHTQKYTRHSVVSIEDGMAAIDNAMPAIVARQNPKKAILNGIAVNVKSLRLQTFFNKGITCVSCGIQATHFALEQGIGQTTHHLNLWATDANGDEYLMTHDHILARSLGGLDRISNTQTMCSPCNAEKSIGERIENEKRAQQRANNRE